MIPALMRAGVMINPPPAPMHPVISPAHSPIKMETMKIDIV